MHQVVFELGKQLVVRVNDEVKATHHVPNGTISVGQIVELSKIVGVTKVELVGDERDCGHVTILQLGDGYKMFFDFRHNQLTARAHLDRADRRRYLGPGIEFVLHELIKGGGGASVATPVCDERDEIR